jgi:integrase
LDTIGKISIANVTAVQLQEALRIIERCTVCIVHRAKQTGSLILDMRFLKGEPTAAGVFPSARKGRRPLSDNGVRTALRSMGYNNEQISPHGFRAMARTLLDEELGFPVDHIGQQLAHAVKDPLGRAYNRTKHLDERTKMMQRWADYLDELRLVEI